MSVHYKFKSALDFDTISFDGLHISVLDLKKAIVHQKRLGKTHDFDLQITNAQTKEEYGEDSCLIPKNTSLIIARIPLTTQYKKQWNPQEQQQKNSDNIISHHHQPTIESENANLDLSRMNGSEEEKIQAMMMQSTMEYDPQNYQKVRNTTQTGEVPPNYRCFRCNKTGHWIKNCPTNVQGKDNPHFHYQKFKSDGPKKMTGIPRTFITQQQQQQQPEDQSQMPQSDRKQKVPEELICSICEDLFTDAVMTPCCGVSFCDECVRTALLESEENECPDCKEKGTSPGSLIPNRFLRNSVNSFRNETGYIKMRQSKAQSNSDENQQESEFENADAEVPQPTQEPQQEEFPAENTEVFPQEGQTEEIVDEQTVKVPVEGNFDAENDNAYQGEDAEEVAEGVGGKDLLAPDDQPPYKEGNDDKDHSSDDDDNITVTVPPAHMQVVRVPYRDRHRHRHYHDHEHHENYNQDPNSEGNSNMSNFDEKEGHSEEGHDYKFRHHNKKPMQIPSVSSSYREEKQGNGSSANPNQNYPSGPPNQQPISTGNENQDHYRPNPSGYHGGNQVAPSAGHHPQQPMHGHYAPQQQQQVPYGQPHYGAPMGMRPIRFDHHHGGYRHPIPPPHMVRPGYRGPDPYNMPRQRHIAPAYEMAARTVQQQFGTGIIEDPLAAFNRIMQEKELRKERSRRSPDRDRRSRSFDRKRSPIYSPDNHRKSNERDGHRERERGGREKRSEDREGRRRHRSSSYCSDSSRSFSRSRSRSRKRVARRRSRSRSHSPARTARRRDNYSKDHFREDRHRSPDRYRGRGGYRGRSSRGGYYNPRFDNRQSDYNQSSYHSSSKQNEYSGYQEHAQPSQPINQQVYNMDGYTNPFESDTSRTSGVKGTSPAPGMISSHPYEVPVHTIDTIEEQPPPPGFETLPKEEEMKKVPPTSIDENNQKNSKNDSFDSGAHLPDTTDRKYLSEDELVPSSAGKRSEVSKDQKERRSRERKGEHKKGHSRHHSDRKQRDKEKDGTRDKDRESSTDDGKRDKKSKDKKKRKKSKETEKKKSKKDRKDKDKDREKRHHHSKESKEPVPNENAEKEVKIENNSIEEQEPDIPTTVSNTNENSMEAPDSSTTHKETSEFTPPVQEENNEEPPEKPDEPATDQFQFKRSDSVLDIYANLDFDGDGDLDEEEGSESPQKSAQQPMPELSKWERDDEQPDLTAKSTEKPSDLEEGEHEEKDDKLVTSEVIKRAENAIIFSRAINAIRPLEIKKISADRQKLYSNPSSTKDHHQSPKSVEPPDTPEFKAENIHVQITVPTDESTGSRSIEIKTDTPQKSKISPIRTSVKDRLGVKVTEKKRSRSRTKSPKRKIIQSSVRTNVQQRKRSRSRSKSNRRDYKQGRKDDRNVRNDSRNYDRSRDTKRPRHSSSVERDRKRERDRPKESDRERDRKREMDRRRSRDRRDRDSRAKRTPATSPSRDSRKESSKKIEPDDSKSKTSSSAVDSSTTSKPPVKSSKEELPKKRHRSSSGGSTHSSSDSESSSDTEDSSSKHHKKHSKKSKKKRASSTESHDSTTKRKKLKKNKKSVKKKKKSKK